MSFQKTYPVIHGNYAEAGTASADIKRALRQLGVHSDVLRRVSVASYEAELNMVIHSLGGELSVDVDAHRIQLCTQDRGPGIADIPRAMKEGYSTADEQARDLGFGAGMGLPNMKRNADQFEITSEMGVGTQVRMLFTLS